MGKDAFRVQVFQTERMETKGGMMGKATLTASIAVAKMQEYKKSMSGISEGLPVREFVPLKSHWTVAGHPQWEGIKDYMSYPSQYNGKHK